MRDFLEVLHCIFSDDDASISVDRTDIQEMEFRRPGLQGIAECWQVDWLYRAYIDSDVHCDAQFLCSGLPDNSEVRVQVLGHQVISRLPADRVCPAWDAIQFCYSYSGWTAVDTVMMKISLVEASLSCCPDVNLA